MIFPLYPSYIPQCFRIMAMYI